MEKVVPRLVDLETTLRQRGRRLERAVGSSQDRARLDLERLRNRLAQQEPGVRVARRMEDLDRLAERARAGLLRRLERARRQQGDLALRLNLLTPQRSLDRARSDLRRLSERLEDRLRARGLKARHRLDALATRLAAVSPMAPLERGYSLSFESESGRLIRSAQDVEPGSRIRTRFGDGEVESEVLPQESS